jgi:hypothetical protein
MKASLPTRRFHNASGKLYPIISDGSYALASKGTNKTSNSEVGHA